MKRFLPLTVFLFLAMSSLAAPPRRAVARPARPNPPLASWSVAVSASGGLAPSVRTGIVVDSAGRVTLLDHLGQTICTDSIAGDDLGALSALVTQANPGRWLPSYALVTNSAPCCDQVHTTVRLTSTVAGGQPATYETQWDDDHFPLPADLDGLYARVYGPDSLSLRGRFESQCLGRPAPAGWSVTMIEEGGFAPRYQRVTVDSTGAVSVMVNPRAAACSFTLSASETQQFDALIASANPSSWAPTYVRVDNPAGCCDQIHTRLQLVRTETVSGGPPRQVFYSTDWYSDRGPLPSDLNELSERLFSYPKSVYWSFAPQCPQ